MAHGSFPAYYKAFSISKGASRKSLLHDELNRGVQMMHLFLTFIGQVSWKKAQGYRDYFNSSSQQPCEVKQAQWVNCWVNIKLWSLCSKTKTPLVSTIPHWVYPKLQIKGKFTNGQEVFFTGCGIPIALGIHFHTVLICGNILLSRHPFGISRRITVDESLFAVPLQDALQGPIFCIWPRRRNAGKVLVTGSACRYIFAFLFIGRIYFFSSSSKSPS